MERLYHYTRLNSFKSIIKSHELWLSRLSDSNDRDEVIHIYKTIWENIFEKLNQEYQGNDKNLHALGLINKQMNIDSLVYSIDDNECPYGICLSENDDLSQNWNEYGDHSKGIAIGFNSKFFSGIKKQYPHPNIYLDNAVGWERVTYVSDDLEKFFYDIVDETIQNEGALAWINIQATFKGYSPFIKTSPSKDEREIRIVYYPNKDHDYKNSSSGIYGLKDGHCTINWFDKNSLDALTIGSNCSETTDQIRAFLNKNGIDSSSIDIDNSKYNYRAKKNYKICLVGSSGGHLTHLYMLKPFWEKHDRFWVTFDKEDARSILQGERMYPCYYPTNRSFKALCINTKLAWKVLKKEKPDLVISSGAAVAVPFFWLGKLFFHTKNIYIEVFDRIDKPTVTGKLVYPVTDKFIVEWEEMKKVYKKAINLGSIF